MTGFFETLKSKILSAFGDDAGDDAGDGQQDSNVILGVLLWFVAEADGRLLPEETERITSVLKGQKDWGEREISVIMESIQTAAGESIDIHQFTREINERLDKPAKIAIVENLFRVARADQKIDNQEMELIRKMAGLLHLSHKEFIQAKLVVKGE